MPTKYDEFSLVVSLLPTSALEKLRWQMLNHCQLISFDVNHDPHAATAFRAWSFIERELWHREDSTQPSPR